MLHCFVRCRIPSFFFLFVPPPLVDREYIDVFTVGIRLLRTSGPEPPRLRPKCRDLLALGLLELLGGRRSALQHRKWSSVIFRDRSFFRSSTTGTKLSFSSSTLLAIRSTLYPCPTPLSFLLASPLFNTSRLLRPQLKAFDPTRPFSPRLLYGRPQRTLPTKIQLQLQ